MRLFDIHCDTAYECFKRKTGLLSNDLNISLDRAAAFESYVQAFAIWMPDELRNADAIRHYEDCLSYFNNQIALNNSLISMVNGGQKSKIQAMMTVEGGSVLAGDIARCRKLFDDGVKLITLTWNDENELGFGCLSGQNYGLNEFGKQAVSEMESLGITVDVSHLNDRGFYDVCDIACTPFVASHSNSRAICAHPRNLTDEMFSEIVKRGGLVGINYCKNFVSESVNVGFNDILRHIEHFLELDGQDILCLGSDFDGADMPGCLSGIEKMHDFYEFLSGYYTPELVDKIFFLNAQNFFIKD